MIPDYLIISSGGRDYPFGGKSRFSLLAENGFGLPPIRRSEESGPYQHGTTLLDFRLQSRTIDLVFTAKAHTRAEHYQNRDDLMKIFRPSNTAITLRYLFNDIERDIQAYYSDGLNFDINFLTDRSQTMKYTVRLTCPDPTWYDPISRGLLWENLVDSSVLTDWVLPFSFPMTLGGSAFSRKKSLTYTGTWRTFPTITVTGPYENFSITNLSTNEKIGLDYDIAAGEVLTISLEYGRKTVKNQDDTDLSGTVTSDSNLTIFHIAPEDEVPGGLNEFELAGTGVSPASKVSLSFYPRYLGI
ncbi:MAG: phage tail family protein [Methanothrix sp.]|nr:phage tail family protein [Methanothrix sp.]